MVSDHRLRCASRLLVLVAILMAAIAVANVPSAFAAPRHCAKVYWGPAREGSGFVDITVVGITCANARPVVLATLRSPSTRPPKPWRERANANTGAVTLFLGHKQITGWFVN